MPLDDSNYTLPEDNGECYFTEEEWERAEKAEERIRAKLAKRCKHLVKSPGGPKKRKVDWDKIRAERERLEQKEQDAIREAMGFEIPYRKDLDD